MDRTFLGASKRLDDIDLPKLGRMIGVGEDEIHAFLDVETRGNGFDDRGRPIILFERHIFHKYVPAAKRTAAMNAGLANRTPGGYGKPSDQYPKLLRAMDIDGTAALMSCSWGLGQVMGFNHKAAGYATVHDFVEAMKADEELQLKAAIDFIITNKLDDELRRHDWAGFAKGYNGKNYRINAYDTKLADAYRKWSRIKDTPWSPIVLDPPHAPRAPVAPPAPVVPVVAPVPAPAAPVAPVPVPAPKAGWLAALLSLFTKGR